MVVTLNLTLRKQQFAELIYEIATILENEGEEALYSHKKGDPLR